MLFLALFLTVSGAVPDEEFDVPDVPQPRHLTLPFYHSYDGKIWEQRGELSVNVQEERRKKSFASLKTVNFEKAKLQSGGFYYVSVMSYEGKVRIQAALPVCNLLGSDLLEELTVHVDTDTGNIMSLGYKGATEQCGGLTTAVRPQTYVEIGTAFQALKPLFTVPKPVVNPEDQPSFFSKYVSSMQWWAILLAGWLLMNSMSSPAPAAPAAQQTS